MMHRTQQKIQQQLQELSKNEQLAYWKRVFEEMQREKEEQLKAYYGLPKVVKFCKLCVISNQRPNSQVEFKNTNVKKATIQFNEEGICSACQYNAVKQKIDFKEREQ